MVGVELDHVMVRMGQKWAESIDLVVLVFYGGVSVPPGPPLQNGRYWWNSPRWTAHYLSELRRDFLASVGITYAIFRIAKLRLRHFGEIY